MFPVNAHISMLKDRTRVNAYRQAIFQTVREGDLVVDIGTGTGILAVLALQAGARKVFAMESGPIIDVARKVAKENGVSDRIEFIEQDSREASLPEAADVVITETVGRLGIDEGIIDILADAGKRFLKPGGKIIPQGLAVRALPVSLNGLHPFLFLEEKVAGVRFSSLMELAVNNIYSFLLNPGEHPVLLSSPSDIMYADFYKPPDLRYPLKVSEDFHITKKGIFHGTLAFPEITLTKETTLTLLQGDRFLPSHWGLTFFPASRPMELSPGDTVIFDLAITKKNDLIWKFIVTRKGKKEVLTQFSAFGLPSLKHLTIPLTHQPEKTKGIENIT